MAGLAATIARSCWFLSHAVTPSQRGCCLPVPTRNPLARTDRAHANWLRAWRLLASLVDAVGLLAPDVASGRFGNRLRLRPLHTSRRVSAPPQSQCPRPPPPSALPPF